MTCFNLRHPRSSAASIVTTLHKPSLCIERLINAIKSLLLRPLEQYIPFISRPAVVAPPIPGRSPRPGKVDNLSVNTSLLAPGTDLRRLALLNLDQCSQWRTKHPKTQ